MNAIRRRCLALCVLAAVLAGCLSAPAPVLKLGTNVWPGYEPLYLAREQGVLDARQVGLVELLSASEVMRAYRNGAIDAAALTLDEVITLREMGMRPVIVQVADISAGADVILARPGLTRVEDLRGRRVGVEGTALGAYMLSRALTLNGMNLNDVTPVQLEVHEHQQAFVSGSVDAVVTFDPVRSQLLEAGAVPVFDSSQIPGEIVDVLVVREQLLHSHHAQIQHLIQAWQASLVRLKADPEAAARIMATRLKLPPDEVLQGLGQLEMPGGDASAALMIGAPPVLMQQADRLASLMREHGLIQQQPDLEGLIYSRYPD
ncbi:ABC transporter substrate-binding protein [Marinobacterium weihaiense]|uniref:ABC transporter substrate-binding protein n=1 Tax=Marinobacterium weihaiense TaxID=2851016 RepID=A0ABS6M8J1_9GAMM|nr:ABC transporter substrate-binding protein [Marinobacterium weihaiense]MBV0932602.1 ABC transporter substrate-binding protein [Marinobacterium weihaiense]